MNDLITRDEVTARVRCARSTLYVLMDRDEFPRPIKIGRDNRWIASEVEAWLERQAARREPDGAATRCMRDEVIPSGDGRTQAGEGVAPFASVNLRQG